MWQEQKKMAQHLLIISWGGEKSRATRQDGGSERWSEPKGWCIISL